MNDSAEGGSTASAPPALSVGQPRQLGSQCSDSIPGEFLTLLERAISVAAVTLLAIHTRVEAQTISGSTDGVITGHVIDSATNTPISAATVDVKIAGAAASTARAATGADGSFRIEGIPPGRYSVRIRALGYTPRPLPPIQIGQSSQSVDVGTVLLNAAPVQLQALQVNGQKQEVQLAPDRNTCRPRAAVPRSTCCATFPPWMSTSTTS